MSELKCPFCGADLVLRKAFKNNRRNRDFYVCSNYPKCDTYVGSHRYSNKPMGIPADSRLRSLRIKAHEKFDMLWKSGFMSRRNAYKWVAKELGIPLSECHIGMFDSKMCRKVISLCDVAF